MIAQEPNPAATVLRQLIDYIMETSSEPRQNSVQALKQAPDLQGIIAQIKVQMKNYSLREQAELVADAAMYVNGYGEGVVTAIFLPRDPLHCWCFTPRQVVLVSSS